MKQFTLIALCLSLLCGSALTQQIPQTCAESSSLTPQVSQVQGEWYAWAYETSNGVSCVDVDIAVNGQSWEVNVTYSQQPDPMYMNQTITTSFDAVQGQMAGGVNLTFASITTNQTVKQPTVYKLLYIDPSNNYMLICGYTNATDNASSYGVILGRQREVNSTYLSDVESNASASYSNFLNGTMYQVPQSSLCYTNAATTLSLATSLMAFFYLAIKLVL